SWRVDLTPFIKFGDENTLAIRLDNPRDSSRWYPGGGIYRNVWLVKSAPVHVAQHGIYITTPVIQSNEAAVRVEMKIENNSSAAQRVDVLNYILAPGEKLSDLEPSRHAAKARGWPFPYHPKAASFRRSSLEAPP